MDLSRLSDEDLKALSEGRLQAVSDRGLRILSGEAPPEPKEGMLAAGIGGFKSTLSRGRTAVESIFDPEGAARRGVERGEEIGEQYAPGASLQRVKDVYAERGFLPAAGEVISQIPSALAEQAPQIAATLGGAKAGAMAGARFGPKGALIGGLGGAVAPSLAQLYASNIERQAEEGAEEISRGRALAAAAPGAALEVASTFIPLGRSLIGKLLGPEARQILERGSAEAAEKLVRDGLLKTVGKGAAVGVGVEGGTEVIQQMLERAQAGLPLTSDDALAEYGEAAYGGALVGGPFGAAGRLGQRTVARGEREREESERQAEIQRQEAAQARQEAEEAEAYKLTPEYRQELNGKIVANKDRLREIETLLQNKTLDPDVREEAKEEAKEIRKELKQLTKDMQDAVRASRKEGEPTTVEAAIQRQRERMQERTITDEFGNVVTVDTALDVPQFDEQGRPITRKTKEGETVLKTAKGQMPKAITPEEEADAYQRQANETLKLFKEREDALERLREKEQQEQVRKDEELQTGIRTFLQQTEEMAELEPGAAAATREMAAEKRTKEAQAAAQEMTLDRIQLVLENFGLRAAGIEQEKRLDIESKVNEGRIDRTVTSALGIKGLGGRTVNAADALPNIQNRIQELEDRRQKALVSKDPLMLDNGQLTAKGYDLVATEAKLNELRKLQSVAQSQAPAETATEAGMVGQLQAAFAGQTEGFAVPEAQGLPRSAYPGRIETANKEASGAFDDLVSFVDDLQKKQYIGGVVSQLAIQDLNVSLRKLRTLPPDSPERKRLESRIAQQKAVLPTSTREKLEADVEASKERVINSLVNEVAFTRAQRNMQPLRTDEVQVFKEDIASLLDMLVERSLAPAPGMLAETTYKGGRETRRGLVEGATEVTEDPRSNIRQLPFGASEKKPRLLNPEEQKKVKASLSQLKSAAIRANSVMQNLDARIRELPPDTPQSEVQALLEERRALFDGAEKAQRDYVNYRTAIGLNLASTGVTQQQAVKNIKGVIRSLKESLIEEGKRPVRAERPVLRQQFQGYGPDESYLERGNRVVRDVQDLLNRPDIDPTVARTLEQAADLIATEDVNPTFLETVDEQIGRIKRGTDKPDASAALINDIQQDMNQQRALRAYAEGEQFTMVPRGQGFAEVEVQPDMFPETRATMRATPTTFQRLQKSREVRKAKEKIASDRADAAKIRQQMLEAKRELEKEKKVSLDTRVPFYKEISDKVKKKEDEILDKISDLAEQIRRGDVINSRSQEARQQVGLVPTDLAQQLAAQSDSIRIDMVELRKLQQQAAKEAKGTPAQQAIKQLLSKQRGLIAIAKETQDNARRVATNLRNLFQARLARGLDLPETKVEMVPVAGSARLRYVKPKEQYDAEMAAYKERIKGLSPEAAKMVPKPTKTMSGKAYKRRVVQVLSPNEQADALEEADRERRNSLRRMQALSPQEMAAKWREKEKEAKAARNAAKNALDSFASSVRKGENPKNFPKYKTLSSAVDRADAELQSIRENMRLLKAAEYDPDQVKRNAPVRTTTGPTKPARLGVTTDQMFDLLGERGRMVGSRTYSVDDIPDLRISDHDAAGEIDVKAATDRLKAMKEKAEKRGIKFKYYPVSEVLPPEIRTSVERLGNYAKRVKGGVMPDGTVFVVIESHDSLADLEKTIAHELIGHYGFEGFVGEQGMKDLLKKVENTFGNVFKMADAIGVGREAEDAAVAVWRVTNDNDAGKMQALKEAIAYTMEKRVDQPFLDKAKRWVQELVGALRAGLKRLGLVDSSNMTTSDLFYLMKQADNNFKEGKPIAYRSANGEMAFRVGAVKYNPGMEEVGRIADKIVARQKTFVDKVKANTTGMAFRTQFIDRLAALEALVNKGMSRGEIDSLKAADVMYFSRMADQRHGFVAAIANNGALKLKDVKRPDGNVEKIMEVEPSASLRDVSEALQGANVGNAEATGRLFTMYLAAERAQRVGKDKLNFGPGLTDADLTKALAIGRANPAFQKARNLYNEYNKGLIDFAVQSGALSKELGNRLSSTNDYVPFYRVREGVVDLVISGEKPIRIGDIKNQPYLKELVGGDQAIMDFFTSSLQNTTMLTDMALKNLATRNAAFVMKDLGIGEIQKGTGPATKNVVRFKRDGIDYHLTMDKKAVDTLFGENFPVELIAEGMEGIKISMPLLVRAMALPANTLRKFITRDPRYAIRQLFRDSMDAALTTGTNAVPVLGALKQATKMFSGKSEEYQKLQRRGIVGGQVITGAPEDMQKIMQHITSGRPGWDWAFAKLDQIALAGDAATRASAYNSFLKQGLSEREATLASLEIMNFGRRGVSPSMYFLNATIPFFNAGIQGIDKIYRAFTGQMPYNEKLKVQQKLIARGLMMAAFTMTYAAMMQDDEAYENATPEQRYGNWFIRIPGLEEPFRVPIPFEVGLLFKSIPEGVFNAMFTDEDTEKIAKDLAKQIGRSLPGGIAESGVPIPAAVKPILENITNTSFFSGRDIVDARLEGVEKELQYRDKTPELLKALGPITAALGISPVQMENLIRGYFGTLGIGIVSIANPILGAGEAGAVEGRPSELPIVGGLLQPNDAGRVVIEAYDSMKVVERAQRSYSKLLEEGKEEEAQRFLEKNIEKVSMASFAGSVRQQMGELAKAERAIRALPSEDMSPQEKRKQIDELRDIRNLLAKQFIDVSAEIKRQGVSP